MTAEVVIVNKSAVALAADSAVTVSLLDSRGNNNDKIFNTANKLFALSKTAPIGIMVYNTMELGGVPWETIIKQYRRVNKGKKLEKLEQYADDFFNFLCSNESLFPEAHIDQVTQNILTWFFYEFRGSITSKKIASNKFNEYINLLEKKDFAEGFSQEDLQIIIRDKSKVIDNTVAQIFKAAHIKGLKTKYRKLAALALIKDIKLSGYSGVVFSGFGENEMFPTTIDYYTDLIILGKVRKKKNDTYTPSQFDAGKVLPFAQEDITRTVLEGINPQYAGAIQSSAIDFFIELPNKIVQEINELDDIKKDKYSKQATEAMRCALIEFFNLMDSERKMKHTFQIERAIQMMPFSELAEVAEVFIRLTQVRQRLSPDSETVGGPVDVAVISKADGFVWIKRKFYFDKELNYSFSQNYMQE